MHETALFCCSCEVVILGWHLDGQSHGDFCLYFAACFAAKHCASCTLDKHPDRREGSECLILCVRNIERNSDCRQLGISLHTLDNALPLYDGLTGEKIDEAMDRLPPPLYKPYLT